MCMTVKCFTLVENILIGFVFQTFIKRMLPRTSLPDSSERVHLFFSPFVLSLDYKWYRRWLRFHIPFNKLQTRTMVLLFTQIDGRSLNWRRHIRCPCCVNVNTKLPVWTEIAKPTSTTRPRGRLDNLNVHNSDKSCGVVYITTCFVSLVNITIFLFHTGVFWLLSTP